MDAKGCKYAEFIGNGKVKCYIDGSIRNIGTGCRGKWYCKKYKPTLWQKTKDWFYYLR